MEYLEKVEYHRLRSAVKGYAKEGISLAKEISKNKGNERSLLRKIKNSLGSYTRECYIAYGLIRGVPYKSIEKKCDLRCKPTAKEIKRVIENYCPYHYSRKFTLENIEQYLKEE